MKARCCRADDEVLRGALKAHGTRHGLSGATEDEFVDRLLSNGGD